MSVRDNNAPLPSSQRMLGSILTLTALKKAKAGSRWIPAFAGMTTVRMSISLLLLTFLFNSNAFAQNVLIRGATVHTADSRGTLKETDVLVQDGVIRAVGSGLAAPAGVAV